LSAEAFSVRVAALTDAESIRLVSVAAGGLRRADQRAAITDANRLVVVAESGGKLVGWAKTHFYEDALDLAPAGHFLGGVNVVPEFRRRGIAMALTRMRLEWIFARASNAWFVTNVHNTASIALHAQLGFAEVARAPEFHGVAFDGGAGILFHATSAG
jgi:aminoglycoside 6'-N-acetyltransferase I